MSITFDETTAQSWRAYILQGHTMTELVAAFSIDTTVTPTSFIKAQILALGGSGAFALTPEGYANLDL